MTREVQIGRESAKISLKSHLRSRNLTNNKRKAKNLHTSYTIPHIMIFKNNLGLYDSRIQIERKSAKIGLKSHLRFRNSTNNKCKPKNLHNIYKCGE